MGAKELAERHDALASDRRFEEPRDPQIPGQDLPAAIKRHPSVQSNWRTSGEDISHEALILAAGKHVVVVGGGDTVMPDCVGTAFRQGARSR